MTTDLQGLLGRLVSLLDAAGVPFMIAGSFASTAHGLPRTTQDLDVVIDPPSPGALDTLLGTFAPATSGGPRSKHRRELPRVPRD